MVELALVSCSHGRGVITSHRISRGEFILRFTGPVLSRSDLPKPLLPKDDYFLQIGEDRFLGPSGEIDDFINHSCSPNSGLVIEPNAGASLVSLKDIEAGETLLFDYSTSMLDAPCEMDCSCMSIRCRGRIRDFRFLPREVRQEYIDLGIVPAYVLARLTGPLLV